MSAEAVHQLLHGYRSGHSQIAGSVRLSNRDADLITRLSDLSGSLSSGLRFDSYLTCYPLPSGEYYAIGRTWPDKEAPRTGCVLTHTVLVPLGLWATLPRVTAIDKLFHHPSSSSIDAFRAPLELEVSSGRQAVDGLPEEGGPAFVFVERYFGKALRPIVWFDAKHPELFLWQVLQGIWPRLRSNFAACTYSLQPRTREDGPFDLLFAPSEIFSRFTKLSPDHLITGSVDGGARVEHPEPWCRYWAATLLGDRSPDVLAMSQFSLWHELNEEPTSVRKLFLLHELLDRAQRSPNAGVGAIDVIESLARSAEAAMPVKHRVVSNAIAAASAADNSEDGLSSLRLIDDRLRRESFRAVAESGREQLAQAASSLAAKAPDHAIKTLDSILVSSANAFRENPYVEGVLQGLRWLASSEPLKLTTLRDHPNVATELLRLEPRFIVSYLGFGGPSAKKSLADWLETVRDPIVLRSVRAPLLPLLIDAGDLEFLSRTLRDVPAAEVHETLNVLSSRSDVFADPSITAVVANRISSVHPELVRKWAAAAPSWSSGIATIVASTYSPNRRGLVEFLDDSHLRGQRRADTLAQIIESFSGGRFPYWLRELVADDLRIIETLLLINGSQTKSMCKALHHILREVPDIPLARSPNLILAIGKSEFLQDQSTLAHMAVRSALSEIVAGKADSVVRDFVHSQVAIHWLEQASEPDLMSILIQDNSPDQETVARAWKWLADAPVTIYRRQPSILPGLCDSMMCYLRYHFPVGTEKTLEQVLRRVGEDTGSVVRLEVAGRMLRFAFDNVSYPLGQIVALAFPAVYAVAVQESRPPSFLSVLFGWYDWDKGKDLRVTLIDSFLRSDWRPGDLAVAARDANILPKVFKRLYRRPAGDRYLRAMFDDLNARKSPALRPLRDHLAALLANPNFYEEWD